MKDIIRDTNRYETKYRVIKNKKVLYSGTFDKCFMFIGDNGLNYDLCEIK